MTPTTGRPRTVLRLTELEARDVPAWWGVTAPSPPAGATGSTAATHAGELVFSSNHTPNSSGLVTVWADSAAEAVVEALTGSVTATLNGEATEYPFNADTVGAVADGKPYAVSVSGSAVSIALEDMAWMDGVTPDNDYNDRSWAGVTVQSAGDPVVYTGSWTLYGGEPPESTGVALKVTMPAPDKFLWTYTVTNHSVSVGYQSVCPGLNGFSLTVADASEVTDLATSMAGWTKSVTVVDGVVRWHEPVQGAGPYIPIGGTGTFSFQTPPLPVAKAWAVTSPGGKDYGGQPYAAAPVSPEGAHVSETESTAAGHTYIAPPVIPEGEVKGPRKVKVQITRVNDSPVDANGLKVAKWENAFEMASGVMRVKPPAPGNNLDFIDADPDYFRVWVYDEYKWDDMDNGQPGHPNIRVKISTSNVKGFEAYNDNATEVDLVRYTGNAKVGGPRGWYWSDSHILVSNAVDDEAGESVASSVRADEQPPGDFQPAKYGVYQWRLSDRTHRVALRGSVTATYPFDDGSKGERSASAAVPARGVVKVHATIVRTAAQASGGIAPISVAKAKKLIWESHEQLAQIGLAIVGSGFDVVDPPPGVILTDKFDTYADPGNGNITLTSDEIALLGDQNVVLRTAATDDIELYFVADFTSGDRGVAYSAAKVPDQKYADSVVMNASLLHTLRFAITHEYGHVLLNDLRHFEDIYPGPAVSILRTRLMHSKVDWDDGTVWYSKRLTASEDTLIHDKNRTGNRKNLISSP